MIIAKLVAVWLWYYRKCVHQTTFDQRLKIHIRRELKREQAQLEEIRSLRRTILDTMRELNE